ncbi:hypothetical protein [Chitinilyticum litopenaei]|uniref:hypothetical protein n=1 Tax=Chitinilyticum litopenaei TaxID=1121276 RepID=UPI0004261E59|nr:hypothetical protein [Chitinilyticum litopenaei]
MKPALPTVLLSVLLAPFAHADKGLHAEISTFIHSQQPDGPWRLESLVGGDLDGDGDQDALLLLQRIEKVEKADEEGSRRLLILRRNDAGRLELHSHNDKAVFCRQCGGVYGDPLAGMSIGRKGFRIEHYGGSGWRWSNSFTFAFSRRDQDWQLIEVQRESFHASTPDEIEAVRHRPPGHFGLIAFRDFAPDDYLGRGKR